jgi:hypothetical protein
MKIEYVRVNAKNPAWQLKKWKNTNLPKNNFVCTVVEKSINKDHRELGIRNHKKFR